MNDEREKPPDLSERTKVFALRVIKMFSAPPKTEVARVLGKQVLRSGTSVGANYREAHRARSKFEHRSHGMAFGSRQAATIETKENCHQRSPVNP